MADKTDLQNQFMSLTGADEDRARFFLESAKWDINVRIKCTVWLVVISL